MKITLADEDAERYGVGPVVEFREDRLGSLEAIQMSKATGWSVVRLGHALSGTPLRDETGNAVMQTDALGELLRDETGNPMPVRDIETTALVITAWLAVRKAGADVAWKDFDIDLFNTDFGDDEDEGEQAGKAPATSTKRTTSKR